MEKEKENLISGNSVKLLRKELENLKASCKLYMAISGVRLHPTDRTVVYSFSSIEQAVKKITIP